MIVSRKEVAIENLSSTSNNVFDLANLVLPLILQSTVLFSLFTQENGIC